MHAKKYNEIINLSMQEILDCSSQNKACKGGQPSSVCDYTMAKGIAYEQNYRYMGRKLDCRAQYYQNRVKSRMGSRLLSQLLQEPPRRIKETEPRILQNSNYSGLKTYQIKYDKANEKFYYELIYNDGQISYMDTQYQPYTPSFIANHSKSIFNGILMKFQIILRILSVFIKTKKRELQ